MANPLTTFPVGQAHVSIYSSKADMGNAGASDAAQLIDNAISQQGRALIIVATGNSQLDLITSLTANQTINWSSVEVFHIDEYVGISSAHPASFAGWVKKYVTDKVHPARVHYMRGDASNVDDEAGRYGMLLASSPIDLCVLGFGENGHIAFNDPHAADFHDLLKIKRVTLDVRCREQQVGEGHFPNLEAVPKEAITLTCPTLMSARNLICCVPESRKAEAVRSALQGPLSESCPASIVVTHPRAKIYLDSDSAALLNTPQYQNNAVALGDGTSTKRP